MHNIQLIIFFFFVVDKENVVEKITIGFVIREADLCSHIECLSSRVPSFVQQLL